MVLTAPIILASSSPRRLELLQQIGIEPDSIIAANIDETPLAKETPIRYVKRVTTDKAQHIAKEHKNSFILAGDTTVCCGNRILGKAETAEEVSFFLKLLSGRRHHVLTAVCVISPNGTLGLKVSSTMVQFKRLSYDEINHYSLMNEGLGKAGGYAIQGFASSFIKRIDGSYSGVVGLPLFETQQLLKGLGYANG